LATITNIIKTVFQSAGAGGTVTDLNNLGKAQTRLGQSSASAGRSFAAQSAGLGGLVAAYAGAAATTFALQQGFDKLAKSARALQTFEGLNTLAAAAAQDGSALLKSVQEITKSQMTLSESASQINLALSAGFDTRQIEGLSQVAIKASRALGRDLTDAMTRVTRGSAKMETELLDELGIYTKIEPATRAYAAALGRSVTSLSEFERRQAFVNAVITEGERKFASINTTIPSSAEKIEAFGAKILDLGLQLGGVLADFVAPLADFMTNNLTASFASFALVVSLVASKAIQVFLASIQAMEQRLLASSRAVENYIRVKLGVAEAAKAATAAIAGLNLATFRGTQAEKAQAAALQETAKSRALTRSELLQSQKLINNNITALNAERDAFRQNIREAAIARGKLDQARAMPRGARPGDFSDPAEQARNAAIRAANREIASTRPAAIAAVQALPALRTELNQLQTAFTATGAAATGARANIAAFGGAVLSFTGKLASNFAAGVGAVLGLVSRIFFFITIIQLAGSAIANFLGYGDDFNAFFVGVGKTIQKYFGIEQAKKIQNTINGITVGTLENLEKTNQSLRELDTFQFKEKKFLGIEFQVEKSKEDLVKEANSILTTVSTGASDSVQDGIIKGAAAGAAIGALSFNPWGVAIGAALGAGFGLFLDSSVNEIKAATDKFGDPIRDKFSTQLQGFSAEAAENAVQALSMLEAKLGNQAMFDPQARAAKEVLENLILQSAQYSDQLDTISKIIAATGKQSNVIVDQFDFEPVQGQLDYINEAIININNRELRLRIADEDSTAIQEFFDSIDYKLFNVKPLSDILRTDISESDLNAYAGQIEQVDQALSKLRETNKNATIKDLDLGKSYIFLNDALTKSGMSLEDFRNALNTTSVEGSALGKLFQSTVLETNGLNAALLRSESVLADTFKGINDGAIDLETFGQNFKNISNSVILTTRALPKAQEELNKFATEVGKLDQTTEIAQTLRKLIADEQARINAARLNVDTQRELLDVLKEQEKSLKQQLEFNAFINKVTPKPQNAFEAALTISQAGGRNEITSTAEFLKTTLSSAAQDAKTKFDALRDTLKSVIPELSTDEIGTALATSAGNAKMLAVSLQNAGVAIEAVNDNTLSYKETIETAEGGIRTVVKEINLLEASTIALGDQAGKTIEALQGLAAQTVIDAISLLNVEKSLTNEKENALSLANQEYALKSATLRVSREQLDAEIALNNQRDVIQVQERDVSLLEQRISLTNTLAEVEQQTSDNAIAAAEYQLSLQKKTSEQTIRDLEKQAALLDKRTNLLLKVEELRVPEKDAPSDISAKAISLRAGQAVEQFALEMKIIAERKSIAVAEFETEKQILSEKRAQAQRDEQAATLEWSNLLSINEARLQIVKTQQEVELQTIRDRIAQADAQLADDTGLLNLQRELNADKIIAETALEQKKATQQYDDLIARFTLFTAQKDADNAYFAAWEQVLSTLKGTSVKIDYQTAGGEFDVDALITGLTKARDESNQFFENQITQALILSDEQNDLDRARVESSRSRDLEQLASLQSYYAASNALLEQSNRAEQAAAAQRVMTARQAIEEAQSNIDTLTRTSEDSFAATEDAINTLTSSIIDAYGPAIDFMKGKIQEYRTLVNQVAVDLKTIASEEYVAQVRFEIDMAKLKSDAAMAREQFRLEALQADVNLISAKEDSGALTAMDAAKQVNAKQQEILAQQLVIENLRYERAKQEIVAEQQMLLQKAMQDIESIRMSAELQKQKVAADVSYLQSLVSIQTASNTDNQNTNQELIRGLADNQTKFISVLGRAFAAGAKNIAIAIESMGESTGVAYAEAIGPTMLNAIPSALGEVVTTFESSAAAASEAIQTRADAQIEQTKNQYARDIELSNEKIAAADAEHEHKVGLIKTQTEVETEAAKSRIKSAADAGAAEKDKADELGKKALEAYDSLMDKLKEAIKSVATEIVKFVGGIVTSIAQSKVDAAKAREESIQNSLTMVTERLNEVRSDLQSSLSEEVSQRQELIELTNTLVESQAEYIKSLGSQEQKISENSDIYIDNLLKQKTAMLTLASTTQRSIALAKSEKTLGSTALSLQESLNAATDTRIAAEEKLARTQAIIQGITDITSQAFDGLGQSLINLGQAIAAVMQVTGMAGAAGVGGDKLGQLSQLNSALGGLGSLVDTFAKGVQSLKVVNGNFTNAAGQTVANVNAFNNTLTTVGGVISGATSGFGIGSAIAQALGVGGFATQLGGAIGGALGAVLSTSLITGGIGSGIAGAVTSFVGGSALIASAIFTIGLPIIGALIGSLFAKKPKAGATVGFDEEGSFTQSSSYAQGGASSAGMVEGIQSIYTSFFSSLEAYGIELADQAKQFSFSINSAKKSTTASFTSYGQTLKQGITNIQDASAFFINSFLKTFRLGDLIVTEATAYQENLQDAIDYFSTKAQSDRDLDIFKQAIEFAQKFDESIRALKGPATSTADALDLISEAARVNAFQLRSYYTRFVDETADTFGESSTQYEEATAAVRRNALAQLGLAEITTNGTTSLISLREAMDSVDVGAVLVVNALAGITEFAATLSAIGISTDETTTITSLARKQAITDLVADIQDSLESGIALLENPASQAIDTITAVVDNAATRIATVQGVYNQLIVEAADAAQLDIASSSISLANTLSSLELDAVLNSLTIAELQAVAAAEDKIDATTREAAATRLAAQQSSLLAKAQVKLASITKKLYSELLDIPSLIGTASSVPDLLELFDMSSATPFITSLNDMINSIASGSNVAENFNSSLLAIQSEFDSGALTADQYTSALETVTDATIEYISTIEDMLKQYEDVAKQIKSLFDSQAEQASTAAQALGDAINTLLDDFSNKTIEILKIYDKTLASVANSGNELLDLEDSAKTAFETAARAVSEFEKANRLSGRSSASLLSDIAGVEARLNELSTKPFDLSSFIEYGSLTSQLRSLKSEYSTLTGVEREYSDLLKDRTTAQEDLAFATATVDSLSDTLVDTRRTESEMIQKVQDAALEYVKSQEELQDITLLLAESNFNLNQVRASEADSVRTTITLLGALNQAFSGLQDITNSLITNEDTLRADLIASATATYEARLALASEADALTLGSLSDLQASITEYFDGLISAANGISDSLSANPLAVVSQATQDSVTEITAANLAISDQFSNFSDRIIEYIDFNDANASLEAFSNSLNITQNRLGVLASEGGSLSLLNTYFNETYRAISILLASGSFEDLSFERIRTEFGSVFTAVAADVDNIRTAVASLSIDGNVAANRLLGLTNYLRAFNTQIGTISVALEGIDVSNIPAIIESISIDTSPLQGITNLVQAINLVDTDLGTLNIVNLNNLASSITTIISGIGSSLNSLDLSISSQVSTEVTTFVNGLNSLANISINTSLQESVIATIRTYVESIGETSIENVTISATLADSAIASIETYIESIGSNDTAFTISNSTLSENAILAVSSYVNSIGDNNSIFAITGNTLSGNAVLAVQNYVNSIGANNSTFAITGNTLSGNAVLAVRNYVTSIGANNSTFAITVNTLSGNAILAVQNYVNSIGANNSTFAITSNTLSGNAILAVRNYVNSIGDNNSTFAIMGNTLLNNAVLAVQNYVNSIGANNSTFAITGNTLSDNALLAMQNYVNSIGNSSDSIPLTYADSELAGKISAFITNVVAGTGILMPFDTATAISLAGKISAFITNVVAGTGILMLFNTAIPFSLAGRINAFIGSVVTGTGILMPFNTETPDSLAGKISAFIGSVVAGTGLNLTYSGSTLAVNISSYIGSFNSAISASMSGIASVFDTVQNPVQNLIKAIRDLNNTASAITTTGGLADAIKRLTDSTGISALTSRFTSLRDSLSLASGTSGIDGLITKLTALRKQITDSWSNVVLTAQSTTSAKPAYVQIVTSGTAAADPNIANIKTIADNSKKYPKIKGAPYDTTPGTFASGGPVKGPGTSTSDSIPARLSTGEYVIKASSADMLGIDTLNALNSGHSLADIMAKSGRYGDSLVAHINPEEARMLKQRGGAGTRNPRTGMLEFYSKDAGAIGKLFVEQEASKLYGVYANSLRNQMSDVYLGRRVTSRAEPSDSAIKIIQGTTDKEAVGSFGMPAAGLISNRKKVIEARENMRETSNYEPDPYTIRQSKNIILGDTRAAFSKVNTFLGSLTDLVGKTMDARGLDLNYIISDQAPEVQRGSFGRHYFPPQGLEVNSSLGNSSLIMSGAHADSPTMGVIRSDGNSPVNRFESRAPQTLDLISRNIFKGGALPDKINNTQITKDIIRSYLNSANIGNRGNFTDFYMLNDITKRSISNTSGYSTGGLVSKRDSINAMLEPGEFVLRKQAVDRMGLDAAVRLNSTGDAGTGDIEVEVNINNNGTSQTITSTPEVRRENGKIVVDIILEDLRNNGPIKRQIRSIR
jgi:hypothetical protein